MDTEEPNQQITYMKQYLIIDGRHMLWRTADVFSSLSVDIDGDDVPVGGVYGFLSVLSKVHKRYGGQVFIAWEGKNNFRYKLYGGYKKRGEELTKERKDILDELNDQELKLKAILRSMGVAQYSADGGEADDVIGTLSERFSIQEDAFVAIYSGDSDLRQLATDRIAIFSPGKNGADVKYDARAVSKKYEIQPSFIADMKALAGDSSDNIPGVKGIGEKTAIKLIRRYGGIEDIFDAVSSSGIPILSKRLLDSLISSEGDVRLYLKLTTIDKGVKLIRVAPKADSRRVVAYFKLYKFASLMGGMEMNSFMTMGGGDANQ